RRPGRVEALRSPLTDSNRRPPPYHGIQTATGRNRRQRFWLVLAASAPVRFATDCDRLQPRGSIKAPSSVVWHDYKRISLYGRGDAPCPPHGHGLWRYWRHSAAVSERVTRPRAISSSRATSSAHTR